MDRDEAGDASAGGGEGDPAVADEDAFPDEDEIIAEVEGISLTPEEHQRIKALVNGEKLDDLRQYDRRYLVAGAGGDEGAAERRETVYRLLDGRTDPPAVAMTLEEFGLTREELRLWVRAFDVLCGRASHVVGVIEDFDGGYVWELGLLFAPTYREKVWVLKRRYADDAVERETYENGMAASHVELLLTGDRCFEWVDPADLPDAVAKVP